MSWGTFNWAQFNVRLTHFPTPLVSTYFPLLPNECFNNCLRILPFFFLLRWVFHFFFRRHTNQMNLSADTDNSVIIAKSNFKFLNTFISLKQKEHIANATKLSIVKEECKTSCIIACIVKSFRCNLFYMHAANFHSTHKSQKRTK